MIRICPWQLPDRLDELVRHRLRSSVRAELHASSPPGSREPCAQVGRKRGRRRRVLRVFGAVPTLRRAREVYIGCAGEGGSMDNFTVKVEEMIARELRVARGWLIAVALVAFVQQILFAYNLPPKIESKHRLFVIIACVQFAVF